MSGVAVAIGASAVIGAGVGMYTSNQAADAQEDAAERATSAELEMFYRSRRDLLPWLEEGGWALGQLGPLLDPDRRVSANKLRESPGYKFRLEEGEKSVQRGQAARGGRLGGRAQKELLRYGQDYASNEYDKEVLRDQQRINNLFTMAGYGQNAGNVLTQAGGNTASNIGRNQLYEGNARASGYINTANAFTGNLRSGVQDYMYYNELRNNRTGG